MNQERSTNRPSVALQLYSVRESAAADFEGTVRRVADVGYAGVEPAGFPETTPAEAARLFRDLGLAVPSAHLPLPLGDHKQEVLEAMEALGCTNLVSGQGPDAFTSLDAIRQTCELFNEANAVAREHGLTLGVHNHWWEYLRVEGRYPYRMMVDLLDPDIFFQVDTYWVQTAGADVTEVLGFLGERAPLLHIKDGPCDKREPMTAVGDGVMDFPAVLQAAGDVPQWLIVEIDRVAGDMWTAVEKSYAYLVGEGLAVGTR
ncbi:MAG: sugar phosphate isomerase/epimerase family protein [Anaerolineae bacterium]